MRETNHHIECVECLLYIYKSRIVSWCPGKKSLLVYINSTLSPCSDLYRVRWHRCHCESSFICGGNRSARRKPPSAVGEDENTTAMAGDRTATSGLTVQDANHWTTLRPYCSYSTFVHLRNPSCLMLNNSVSGCIILKSVISSRRKIEPPLYTSLVSTLTLTD